MFIVSSATGKGWLGFNNGNNASIPGQLTYDHATNVLSLYSSGTVSVTGALTTTGAATFGGLVTNNATGENLFSGSSADVFLGAQVNAVDKIRMGVEFGVGGTHIASGGQLNFRVGGYTAGFNKMALDTSGNLGVGVAPSYKLDVSGSPGDIVRFTGDANNSMTAYLGSGYQIFQCVDSGTTNQVGYVAGNFYVQTAATERLRIDTSGRALFGHSAAIQGATVEISAVTDGGALGLFGRASDNLSYIGFYQNGVATRTAMIQANSAAGLQFIGGSGGTVHMTLDTSGNLLVGQTVNNTGKINTVTAPSTYSFAILNTAGSVFYGGFYESAAGLTASWNGADTALYLSKDTTSSRSINAAGTLNASGADYAEYEQNNGLTIIKGSVVGFKSDGTLTLTFSEAVRFAIKSTNPSYVGGDTWGTEEQVGIRPFKPADDADAEVVAKYEADLATFETALEAARQLVDRIAYSGKVPVNVQGAIAGDYIIAVAAEDGSIGGQAVSDPDFAQYKLAVGRVNRILDDGRAEVAVIIH